MVTSRWAEHTLTVWLCMCMLNCVTGTYHKKIVFFLWANESKIRVASLPCHICPFSITGPLITIIGSFFPLTLRDASAIAFDLKTIKNLNFIESSIFAAISRLKFNATRIALSPRGKSGIVSIEEIVPNRYVCESNSISDPDGIDDDAKYENSCDRRERTTLHDAPDELHAAHCAQTQVQPCMYYYLSICECNHASFPEPYDWRMQSAKIAIVFALQLIADFSFSHFNSMNRRLNRERARTHKSENNKRTKQTIQQVNGRQWDDGSILLFIY